MGHDQQTVHYVTQDAMPNLKMRVTLTLLSASRSRPAISSGDQARQEVTSASSSPKRVGSSRLQNTVASCRQQAATRNLQGMGQMQRDQEPARLVVQRCSRLSEPSNGRRRCTAKQSWWQHRYGQQGVPALLLLLHSTSNLTLICASSTVLSPSSTTRLLALHVACCAVTDAL